MMAQRRNRTPGTYQRSEPMTEAALDQAYGQRNRGGFLVNWTALGVVGSFLFSAVIVIAYAVNMNATVASNHALENARLDAQQAQITQLLTDARDTAKQNLEILLHLSSIDQTLKDKSHEGETRVYIPSTGNPPTGNTINVLPDGSPSHGQSR